MISGVTFINQSKIGVPYTVVYIISFWVFAYPTLSPKPRFVWKTKINIILAFGCGNVVGINISLCLFPTYKLPLY